jgi:membrane fusion protein (multidrug efflux system)
MTGSPDFSRTLRQLAADPFRRSLGGLVLAALLLLGWGSWFTLARVAVREPSESARLEVEQAPHPIEAPVAGRLIAVRLALGSEVAEGEVVAELDSEAERLLLVEERRRLAALPGQLAALRRESAAHAEALHASRAEAQKATEQARARQREAQAMAFASSEEASRLGRLRAGERSELELIRSQAEANRRQAAAEALTLDVGRVEWDLRAQDGQHRARLEEVARLALQLEAQLATSQAAVARLEHAIAERQIRAPIAGRIGEVAGLRVGAVVREGDRIGAVVPRGGLRIVAEFAVPRALGRIRPGQPAELRLFGFPWLQYGSVAARVLSAATESRTGQVRVELAVERAPPRIPLEHGLPGVVEVEIERVSPATLVLRAAGRMFGGAPGEGAR